MAAALYGSLIWNSVSKNRIAQKPVDADGIIGREGRFFPHFRQPKTGGLSEKQRREFERLAAIGYVSGSVPADDIPHGVSFYDPDKADSGLNLYCSGHAPEAFLMDMSGKIVHRWRVDSVEGWLEPESNVVIRNWWRRIYPQSNGDLFVLYADAGVLRIDHGSEIQWAYSDRTHHDLEIQENGDILVLTRTPHVVPWLDETMPVMEEYIVTLGAGGNFKQRLSLFDALRDTPHEHLLHASEDPGDRLHTNSLTVLDGMLEHINTAFAHGHILLSMRNNSALAVLDPGTGKVVWSHQGDFEWQHEARILPAGTLLFFDNRGLGTASRVLEYDVSTMKPIWTYVGTEERPFYTPTCGIAQRLPNGNTLITESDPGRAFEVTPGGEIVWEFHNPERAGDNDQFVATLFDMIRLPADYGEDWIKISADGDS